MSNNWGGPRVNSGRPKLPPGEKNLIQAYSLDQPTIIWIQLEARARNMAASKIARQLLQRAIRLTERQRAKSSQGAKS